MAGFAAHLGRRQLLALGLFTAAATARAAGPRILASAYPPYRIGPTSGILNEIVLAACAAAGLDVAAIEMLPSERARRSFEADPLAIYLDADSYVASSGLAGVTILKLWAYQVHIYYLKSAFPAGGLSGLGDVAGKRMGYFKADIAARDYFAGQGAQMNAVNEQAQLFRMLLRGRIDLMLGVSTTADAEFEHQEPRWRESIGIWGPFYSGHSGLVYHADQPAARDFIARFRQGYRIARADGQVLAILERHFGAGKAPTALLGPAD